MRISIKHIEFEKWSTDSLYHRCFCCHLKMKSCQCHLLLYLRTCIWCLWETCKWWILYRSIIKKIQTAMASSVLLKESNQIIHKYLQCPFPSKKQVSFCGIHLHIVSGKQSDNSPFPMCKEEKYFYYKSCHYLANRFCVIVN